MARQRGIVVPITAEENTGRAFDQVNARVAELQATVARLNSQLATNGPGERLAQGMGHAVPEIAAASGAIREFEGNLPIRAVERFLTTTLGLGPVLAAAFPVVGAIALAGVLKEGVDKLIEMREAALAAGETLRKAFEQAIIVERSHADALALTNDKLQQTLDKLEGRPANGLAVGLSEGRVEADKLYESLTKDAEALQKLGDQSKVSWSEKLFGGQADASGVTEQIKTAAKGIDDVKREYDETIQNAQNNGATTQNIADIREAEMARLQSVYAKAESTLGPLLKNLRQQQEDFEAPYSSGVDHSKQIAAVEGALRLFSAQQQSIGEQYRNSILEPKVANAKAADANSTDDGSKLADAQRGFDAALLKAQEQAATNQAASAKLAADLAIAALDDKHKRQLVSDTDYYAQRAAIQEKALTAEADAVSAKQGAIDDQIRKLIIQRGKDQADPAALTKDDTRIVELQTQVNALEDARLKLVQQRADVATKAATEDFEATKKAADEQLALAAQLEAIRGGSTTARDAETRKQFNDRRRTAGAAGAGTVNTLEGIADARLGESDASQAYSSQSSELNTDRQRVNYQAATGAITAAEAQRQKIELNKEEAAALQPVIASYQKLADLGVEGAAAKVDELKERVAELSNPVNQVAADVRSKLGDAFQTLFENMDKGRKALDDFGKSLEKMVLQETYKQVIQPAAQQGLSALIPNSAGRRQSPTPSVGSALLGLIPGANKIPGVGVGGGGAGAITVQIINQGTPMESGGVSQQMSGGNGDDFEQRVLSVILKDAETNGSGIQAIIGAFQNG